MEDTKRVDLNPVDLNQLEEKAAEKSWELFCPNWEYLSELPALSLRALVGLTVSLHPFFASPAWLLHRAIPRFERFNKDIPAGIGDFYFPSVDFDTHTHLYRAQQLHLFIRRISIAARNLYPLGELEPAIGSAAGEMTLIKTEIFINWASKKGWNIPSQFSGLTGKRPVSNVDQELVSKTLIWVPNARKLGEEKHKQNPKLKGDRLASEVHREMVLRAAAGESGFTGNGNRVPSAGSIKRHALTGITTK